VEIWNGCKILVEKPLGIWSLEIPRRRLEDNLEMDLREIGCESERWMKLPASFGIRGVELSDSVTERQRASYLQEKKQT
jgi:hypothetical protein